MVLGGSDSTSPLDLGVPIDLVLWYAWPYDIPVGHNQESQASSPISLKSSIYLTDREKADKPLLSCQWFCWQPLGGVFIYEVSQLYLDRLEVLRSVCPVNASCLETISSNDLGGEQLSNMFHSSQNVLFILL